MASIASALIRTCRLLQRGILSTVGHKNTTTFFRPQMAVAIARSQQNKLATTSPPSTILTALFGPLRSFPGAGGATASAPAFGALANSPHSHPPAFTPIRAAPFRASSGSSNWHLAPLPRQDTAPHAVDIAQPSSSQTDPLRPLPSPLADEILHHIVAARFAFPDPSFDL